MHNLHTQIIAHLQQQQPAEALRIIEDNEWSIEELHIFAWKGQALMRLHRYEEALQILISGIRKAKQVENIEAEQNLRALQKECTDVLIALSSSSSSEATPLGSAIALIKSGELEAGQAQLVELRDQADAIEETKMSVLSRLALAEIPQLRINALQEAAELASRSGDHNLITAVVRAKKQHNVAIAPHIF
jgi:hypothetical protein